MAAISQGNTKLFLGEALYRKQEDLLETHLKVRLSGRGHIKMVRQEWTHAVESCMPVQQVFHSK